MKLSVASLSRISCYICKFFFIQTGQIVFSTSTSDPIGKLELKLKGQVTIFETLSVGSVPGTDHS